MPPDKSHRASKLHPALALVIAIGICFAASAIGGLFTATSVSSWYLGLHRPSWNPPGWVFGPVWATLYLTMAISVWLVWRKGEDKGRANILFAIQLALNVAWSALFFGARSPGLALLEIIVLIVAIIATIYQFSRSHRLAALLMGPYLAWVSFAAVLNATIWWLNRAA